MPLARLCLVSLFVILPGLSAQQPAPAPALPEELLKVLERGSKNASKPLPGSDPLLVARELALKISGDVDKAAEMQFRVSTAMADLGRHEEAAALAGQIRDFRAGLALIHLCHAILDAGLPVEKTAGHLAEAQKRLADAKPWQQQLLHAALHDIGLRLDWDAARLEEIMKPVTDEEILAFMRVAKLVSKAVKGADFDAKAADEIISKLKGPAPGLVTLGKHLLATALLERVKKDPASTAHADTLTDQALDLMRGSKVSAVEQLLDAATELVKAGFEEAAKRVFTATEGRLGGETEHAALVQFKVARLWKLRGRKDVLPPLLENAEKQARALRQMDRPFALSWVAAGWRVAGDKPAAARCLEDAVFEAGTNVNPRMRLVGCIEICLMHAREGLSLAESLFAKVETIAQGKTLEAKP